MDLFTFKFSFIISPSLFLMSITFQNLIFWVRYLKLVISSESYFIICDHFLLIDGLPIILWYFNETPVATPANEWSRVLYCSLMFTTTICWSSTASLAKMHFPYLDHKQLFKIHFFLSTQELMSFQLQM